MTICFWLSRIRGCRSHPCNSLHLCLRASNAHIHWQTGCDTGITVHSSLLTTLLGVAGSICVHAGCTVHDVQGNVYTMLSLECAGLCQGGIFNWHLCNRNLHNSLPRSVCRNDWNFLKFSCLVVSSNYNLSRDMARSIWIVKLFTHDRRKKINKCNINTLQCKYTTVL